MKFAASLESRENKYVDKNFDFSDPFSLVVIVWRKKNRRIVFILWLFNYWTRAELIIQYFYSFQ